MGCKNSGAAKAEGPTKLDKEAKETEQKPAKYDRDAEKDQEIGEEFLNPDKDMDQAATKIQQQWKKKQADKKAKVEGEKPKEEPAKDAPAKEEPAKDAPAKEGNGYNREGEKDQEIGDEFLNPDKDMDEAALKIQQHWKSKQAAKKDKGEEKPKE